jgi:hypothetical protein
VDAAGFVSRCYWLNSEKKFLAAKQNRCHHLATDMIDPDLYPWASTQTPEGFPFSALASP